MNAVRPFAFLICTAYTADLMLITPFLTFSSHKYTSPRPYNRNHTRKTENTARFARYISMNPAGPHACPSLGTVRPRTIRRATTRLIHPQNNWTNKMLLSTGGYDHVSDLTNSITRGGPTLYHGYTTVWLRTIRPSNTFHLASVYSANRTQASIRSEPHFYNATRYV